MNNKKLLKHLNAIPEERAIELLDELDMQINWLSKELDSVNSKLDKLHFVRADFYAFNEVRSRIVTSISCVIEARSEAEAVGVFVTEFWPVKLEAVTPYNMMISSLSCKKIETSKKGEILSTTTKEIGNE